MTKDEAKTQEREALHAITHFSGLFNTGVFFTKSTIGSASGTDATPDYFSRAAPISKNQSTSRKKYFNITTKTPLT